MPGRHSTQSGHSHLTPPSHLPRPRTPPDDVFSPRSDSIHAREEDLQAATSSLPSLLQSSHQAIPIEPQQVRQARRWSSMNQPPIEAREGGLFRPTRTDSDNAEPPTGVLVPRTQSVDFRPGVHFSDKDSIKYLSVISSREPSPPDQPIRSRSTASSQKSERRDAAKGDRKSLAKRFKSGLANLKEEHHKPDTPRSVPKKAAKPVVVADAATVATAFSQAMSGNGPWRPQKQQQKQRPDLARKQSSESNTTVKRTKSSQADRSTGKRSSQVKKSPIDFGNSAIDKSSSNQSGMTSPVIQNLARGSHFEGSSTSSLTSISTKSKSSISDQTTRSSVESASDLTDQTQKPEKKPIKSILKNRDQPTQDQGLDWHLTGGEESPVIVSYPHIHPPSPSPVSPLLSDRSLPIFSNNIPSKPVDPRIPPPRPPRPPGELGLSPLSPSPGSAHSPLSPGAASPTSKRSLRAPILTVIKEVSTPTSEDFPKAPPLSESAKPSTTGNLPPPENPPPARPLPRVPRRRSNSLPHAHKNPSHKRQRSAPSNDLLQKPQSSPTMGAPASAPPLPSMMGGEGGTSSPVAPKVVAGASPRQPPKMRQDAVSALKNLDWSSYQTAIGGPTGGLLMSGAVDSRACHSNSRTDAHGSTSRRKSRSSSHGQVPAREKGLAGNLVGSVPAAQEEGELDSCDEEEDEDDLVEWFESFGFAHAGKRREGEKQYRVGAARTEDEEFVQKLYWKEVEAARKEASGEGEEEEGGAGARADQEMERAVSSGESIIPPGKASPELGVLERDRKVREEGRRREDGRQQRLSKSDRIRYEGNMGRLVRKEEQDGDGQGVKRASGMVVMGCNLRDVGPTDWQNY